MIRNRISSKALIVTRMATILAAFASAPISAYAQITFTADVEGSLTSPDSPCPDGAFRSGDAHIAAYGDGQFSNVTEVKAPA